MVTMARGTSCGTYFLSNVGAATVVGGMATTSVAGCSTGPGYLQVGLSRLQQWLSVEELVVHGKNIESLSNGLLGMVPVAYPEVNDDEGIFGRSS